MLAVSSGCHLWEVTHQPVIHNPFPQLSRVAVAPFFNQSDEPTVDGREFALAYFAELQATPGFEVVPLGVVEEAILAHRVDLSDAGEARRLANILGVDAVVIGSVTDFTPYYPPRCGLRVEWYAANPGFHEIPPGYGLPWGTPEEEFIPQPLVFEAEMALAKAQMATQTPDCPKPPLDPPQRTRSSDAPDLFSPVPSSEPPAENAPHKEENGDGADTAAEGASDSAADAAVDSASDSEITGAIRTLYEEQISEEELPASAGGDDAVLPPQSEPSASADTTAATGAHDALPPDWPDQSRFVPPAPCAVRPPCVPYNGPVMTHTRIYQGNDGDFTAALATYYHFRNDARFGGWQTYLQRSDDFIRFCCHVHINEMLSARGGADQTRVVWQWSDCR
ncbi:MAG: CsgG/HfaB family protein [Planctomycetes bacterium]|nr:CsgG/HfaB family protein [Planctomycetota bacterium]